MPIKILIITGANTAKEINPYTFTLLGDNYFFREAQKYLKEYRITNTCGQSPENEIVIRHSDGAIDIYEIGSKVEGKCNDQDLTAIIL